MCDNKTYLYTKCLLTGAHFKWEVHFCKHINEDMFGDWATLYQCDVESGCTRTSNAKNMKELVVEYGGDNEWDEEVCSPKQYDQFVLQQKMTEHLH